MENTFCSSSKTFKHRPLFAGLISLSFLLSACSYSYKPLPNAPKLSPLNDWLYRGAQPQEWDFTQIKTKGIKTVVNFRDEPGWIDWERQKVENLGMKYVSLPWNITQSVKPELLDEFFKILDDPKNRPVFFHCKYGRDRSGVMSVLALMRYEKMPEQEAREMALGTIRPHLRYRPFVNQKIKFFVESRASELSQSSSG